MVVKQAPPPQDLLFVNFGQSLGRDLCMRSLFNVAVVLLLFFCTTPMSIFNYVGLYFSATNVGHSIFLQYMTSALVSAVNSLILLIIELFVAQEKPSCRWYYQRGVYSRCNFYLTMNMLVIPALSFAAITNIYQLIKEDAGNLLDMMKAVYFVINYIIQCVCVQLNNGKFFASLIIGNATSSFFLYMLRVSDLLWSWGSPKFADFQRQRLSTQALNQMKAGEEFPYGYFYSLQITVLYIVMTFSTNVMVIHFSGALYYLIRLYQDSFILHWVYRNDMNS